MKKITLAFFLVFTLISSAQQTISGTFTPAEDYKWIIAYNLIPGSQRYIADTAIKNGKFELKINQDAPKGIYRLVYAIPQDEYYIDVLFNGNEAIEFSFNEETGASFTKSKENILFNTYFSEINQIETEIIQYYGSQNTDKEAFLKLIKKLKSTQVSYEKKSVNLMVSDFIKANSPYIPEQYESVQEFIQHKKETYFSSLDYNNVTLQSAGYLTNKATNYVFTALPLEQSSAFDAENAMIENIKTVVEKINTLEKSYQSNVLYTIWKIAATNQLHSVADNTYNKYLKTIALDINDTELINEIEVHQRLRLGAKAPEITWTKNKTQKSLSTLETSENYLIIFWSSSCSHCLKDLPVLHKKLKDYTNIKVIAIGLEDDKTNWEYENSKLPEFEHVLALGKWQSEYAKLYDIHQTPSYFILNNKKEFVSYPETDKEVIEFLDKKN